MGIYAQSLKTTRMQAVQSAIDSGAGTTATLELVAGDTVTVLAIIPLAAPPSSSVALSVLTLNGTPLNVNAIGAGTVAYARIKNLSGSIIDDQMTVGTAASAEVVLSSLSLAVGQPVSISSGTITHA